MIVYKITIEDSFKKMLENGGYKAALFSDLAYIGIKKK